MTFTLYTRNPYVLPPKPTLREAIPILSRLVKDRNFLDSHVLTHLEEAGRAEDWYVAYRHDDPDFECFRHVRSSNPSRRTARSCLGLVVRPRRVGGPNRGASRRGA